MRSLDWSQTLLGSPEQWPQSLRSALSICLNSRFPIAIYWGQDCLLLYNDAWRPIVGDKHSWALGCPAREVWAEIWDDIGSELAGVLATGEGTFHKDQLLSMHRFGYTEECFFEYTFKRSISAINFYLLDNIRKKGCYIYHKIVYIKIWISGMLIITNRIH